MTEELMKIAEKLSEKDNYALVMNVMELTAENMILEKTIDKAIDYIEKYCVDGVENEYNTSQTVFEEENGNEKDHAKIELLNILKGGDEDGRN